MMDIENCGFCGVSGEVELKTKENPKDDEWIASCFERDCKNILLFETKKFTYDDAVLAWNAEQVTHRVRH